MKNVKNYLYLLLGAMLFGCSDFLKEENPGNTTAENYYTTTDGYEGLVNAAYASLRDVYAPTPYVFCAGTDLFFGAHPEVPLGLSTYLTLTSSESSVEYLFKTLYESIQVVNLALHYSDQTENFAQLESRIAELKTIRAYYYFVLAQSFGDVTLIDYVVEAPITRFERDPVANVYQFILSELEEAIEVLPAEQSDFGRVSSRTAQHLLAKAYLARGYEAFGGADDFAMAAAVADAAIGGQGLNLTFEELFAFENDLNEEVLWSVQYAEASTVNGGTHNWDYPWGPLVQGSDDGVNKKNVLHPTEYLYTLFEDADERFSGTFLNFRTNPYQGWILDPDNSPVAYYYPRTADEIANVDAWRAEDPTNRADTQITPLSERWWDGLNQEDFPGLRKFDRVRNTEVQYTHDLYLARLGETYLVAAEAYLQSGNGGLAAERVNAVRARAGVATVAAVDLDFILDERARELAGEGHRWFDLKRTGKLMEYTKARNPDIKTIVDGGVDPFMGVAGNLKILRPIPLSAIALDAGDYPQNPAYD